MTSTTRSKSNNSKSQGRSGNRFCSSPIGEKNKDSEKGSKATDTATVSNETPRRNSESKSGRTPGTSDKKVANDSKKKRNVKDESTKCRKLDFVEKEGSVDRLELEVQDDDFPDASTTTRDLNQNVNASPSSDRKKEDEKDRSPTGSDCAGSEHTDSSEEDSGSDLDSDGKDS